MSCLQQAITLIPVVLEALKTTASKLSLWESWSGGCQCCTSNGRVTLVPHSV